MLEGDVKLENEIQKSFNEFRTCPDLERHEWFYYVEKIKEFIKKEKTAQIERIEKDINKLVQDLEKNLELIEIKAKEGNYK